MPKSGSKLSEQLILAGADIANKAFEAITLIGNRRREFSEDDKAKLSAIAEKFNAITKMTRETESLASKIKEPQK